MEKYISAKSDNFLFLFHNEFSTFQDFVRSVNLGLKTVSNALNFEIPLSSHSWATIARNQCNVSKSDIAECLNHSTNTITDIYIKKDWAIIDKTNRAVIDVVFSVPNLCQNKVNNGTKSISKFTK